MTKYQQQQIDLLENEGIINNAITTIILSLKDADIESYVSHLLYKKRCIVKLFSTSQTKLEEHLDKINKIGLKEIRALKKAAFNKAISDKTWRKMKASSTNEKHPIETKVSIKTILTNMKNQ